MIDEIRRCIYESHFEIVDLTGQSPNVMLELGMMMINKGKIMLLRSVEDKPALPFNLQAFHIYQYEPMGGSNFRVLDPGTGNMEPIEGILKSFIDTLETDPAFSAAQEWRPG